MAELNLVDQLAILAKKIESLPIYPETSGIELQRIEALKRGLDDARLALWGRLTGVHTTNLPEFQAHFRARRATEICNRLVTDIKLGLLEPDHPDFSDLWITITDLARLIRPPKAE